MRILILNQFFRPDISPTAQLAGSLAADRAARGDEVTVVASRGGYAPVSDPIGKSGKGTNPRVRRIWTPQLGKSTKLKRLIDYACFYVGAAAVLAKIGRQDVIVSLTTPPFIALAAVLHKALHPRCRLVLWNMDCYPEVIERAGVIRTGGLLSRGLRRLNRWLFGQIDQVVCLDAAMAALLQEGYGRSGRALPIAVVPNWEESRLFPAEAEAQHWCPLPEADRDGRPIILYLGNMGYGHEFETALDAAAELADEAWFLFVGAGSRCDEICEGARRRQLRNVFIHGYVPTEQRRSLMASADVALITLRDEALGVMSPSKLHASLAMRLPIIYVGPAGSNVDEAIRRYGCGLSVRRGDSADIVRFIRDLKSRPEQHDQLRLAARSAFDAAYCDLVTLPQFDQVLDGLTAGQTRTAQTIQSQHRSVD